MKCMFLIISLGVILFLLIPFSCTSPAEKQMQIAEKKVKMIFEDAAFKANGTIEWKEFTSLDLDSLNENDIDSIRREKTFTRMKYYTNEMKTIVSQMEVLTKKMGQHLRSIRVYSGILDDLAQNEREEMEESSNEMKKLHKRMIAMKDSIAMCSEIDSILNLQIKSRCYKTLPMKYYKYKCFVKATFKDDNSNQKENLIDTLEFVFDSEMNQIKW